MNGYEGRVPACWVGCDRLRESRPNPHEPSEVSGRTATRGDARWGERASGSGGEPPGRGGGARPGLRSTTRAAAKKR